MNERPLNKNELQRIKLVWWNAEQCKGKCDKSDPDGCWVLHLDGSPTYDDYWCPIILREQESSSND